MGTKIILSISYIILMLLIEVFIEKRLSLLRDRHQQKMGGGYASGGLGKIHTFLIYNIRILFILMCLSGGILTFIML